MRKKRGFSHLQWVGFFQTSHVSFLILIFRNRIYTYEKRKSFFVITPNAIANQRTFFSIRVFFHGHWQLTGQQGKGGYHLLFRSTTSTRSRTFTHLFATLRVRWLSHIFSRNACVYQTATRWDLPSYRISIWLLWCWFSFVCLLIWF